MQRGAILFGVVATLIIAVVTLIGLTRPAGAAERLTVTIAIEASVGLYCNGTAATERFHFDDLLDTTQVVIRDDGGTIIGKGMLGDGATSVMPDAEGDEVGVCAWEVAVDELPERPFYEVAIGRQPPRVLSLAEVAAASWQPTIFLAYDAGA